MRKLILMTTILLSGIVMSQTTFYTKNKEVYIWNNITEKYDYEGHNNQADVFLFENKFTIFQQKGYSNMICQVESLGINEETENIEFEGISRGTRIFYCIIDLTAKTIKIIYNLDGDTYLSVYFIEEVINK